MSRAASLLLLVTALTAVGAVPAPQPARPDRLVGAYYFPGSDRPEHWYCIKANPHVQRPLRSDYRQGATETADWHTKWALERGLGAGQCR